MVTPDSKHHLLLCIWWIFIHMSLDVYTPQVSFGYWMLSTLLWRDSCLWHQVCGFSSSNKLRGVKWHWSDSLGPLESVVFSTLSSAWVYACKAWKVMGTSDYNFLTQSKGGWEHNVATVCWQGGDGLLNIPPTCFLWNPRISGLFPRVRFPFQMTVGLGASGDHHSLGSQQVCVRTAWVPLHVTPLPIKPQRAGQARKMATVEPRKQTGFWSKVLLFIVVAVVAVVNSFHCPLRQRG